MFNATVELLRNGRGDGVLKTGARTATPHTLMYMYKCPNHASNDEVNTNYLWAKYVSR